MLGAASLRHFPVRADPALVGNHPKPGRHVGLAKDEGLRVDRRCPGRDSEHDRQAERRGERANHDRSAAAMRRCCARASASVRAVVRSRVDMPDQTRPSRQYTSLNSPNE